MNTKIIEMEAISYLKRSLLRTRLLMPSILEGSTEPTWDGHVHVYSDESQTKESHKGKVPIQVKGTRQSDLTAKQIKFDAEVSDLECYLRDGGVIYFVIYVSRRSAKIYYAALTPVKLILILNSRKGSGTTRILLDEFPTSTDKKMNIFLNFLADSKKQASFNETTMLKMEDLKTGIREFSLSVVEHVTKGRRHGNPFLENDVYMYARDSSMGIEIPVLVAPGELNIQVEIPARITVDGELFYTSYKRTNTKQTITLLIGDSFVCTGSYDSTQFNFTYTPAKFVRRRNADAGFAAAMFESGGFEIDGLRQTLGPMDEGKAAALAEAHRQEKQEVQRIVTAMDALHIQDDLDISDLSERERRYLATIARVFCDGVREVVMQPDVGVFLIMGIKQLHILLIAIEDPKAPGNYTLYDFFEKVFPLAVTDGRGHTYTAPQYTYLSAKEWAKLSNVDFEGIVPCYKLFMEDNPDLLLKTQNDVLQLITAFDQGGDKRFLTVAEGLCQLLGTQPGIYDVSNELNLLQIYKRQRTLTDQEKTRLAQIAENGEAADEIHWAAHVLLENGEMARYIFDGLSEDKKELIETYPMFYLWEHTNAQSD